MGVNVVKVVPLSPTSMHTFLSLLPLRLPFREAKNRLYRNESTESRRYSIGLSSLLFTELPEGKGSHSTLQTLPRRVRAQRGRGVRRSISA